MTKRSKNITQLKESQISVCAACNHLRVICSCRRGAFSSLIKRTRHQWDISKETEYQQSVDDLESDLEDYHFCKKYKHHKDYVPVSRFNTSHLPEDLRHPLVCVWLRACARLVVKLKLRHNKVATGRVSFTPFDEGKSEKCDDVHCDYKTVVGAVHKVHGGITIITNKHVVSSDDEAAVARVHFFYDRKEQTVQFKELGTSLIFALKPLDYSVFSCFVHSTEFIQVLKMLKKAQDYSWQQVPEKLRDLTKDYAITISHPHGAAKQVSIGRVLPRDLHESESVNKDEVENARLLSKLFTSCNKSPEGSKRLIGYLKFLDLKTPIQITKYSAATCEGSSGAPVYVGDFEVMNGQQVNIPRTHRGTREIENCFHNYSHV